MQQRLKFIFLAARPKTLPLIFSAVFLGTSMAYASFDWLIFILASLTALLIQILANFANDYGDGVAGTDQKDRKGPMRVVASGLIPAKTMLNIIITTILIIGFFGLVLLYLAFKQNPSNIFYFVLIGIACILAAIFYTMGKKPYGYIGLGDIICLIFFGPVAVLATSMLYGYKPQLLDLLPALACGIFAVLVLNINNIRDIPTDKIAGKKSFALLLGEKNAKIYHVLLLLSASIFWFSYLLINKNIYFAIASLVCFVPLYASAKRIVAGQAQYNLELQKTSILSGLANIILGLFLFFS